MGLYVFKVRRVNVRNPVCPLPQMGISFILYPMVTQCCSLTSLIYAKAFITDESLNSDEMSPFSDGFLSPSSDELLYKRCVAI